MPGLNDHLVVVMDGISGPGMEPDQAAQAQGASVRRNLMPQCSGDAPSAMLQPDSPCSAGTPRANNAQVVRHFTEALFLRLDAAEAADLVTSDFVAHPWASLGVPAGPTGIAAVVFAFQTAFDQISLVIDDALLDGDMVALRYRYGARHRGDLFGIPPTGRSFEIAGLLMARVAQGRVAEFWREEDMLGLQRQLGLASLQPAEPDHYATREQGT